MKRHVIIAGLLAWGIAAVCFVEAAAPPHRLVVYAAAHTYNNPYSDTLPVIEIPFTLNRRHLEFFRPDTVDPAFYGRVFAQATLFDSTGLPVDSSNTYFSVAVESPEQATNADYMLFNKLQFFAAPGTYSARLLVIDATSKAEEDIFIDPFVVTAQQTSRLELAGLKLAFSITEVAAGAAAGVTRMQHGTLRVLDNPFGAFRQTDSTAYLYAELYNLAHDLGETGSYELQYRVYDATGALFRDLGRQKKPRPGRTAVIAQAIDIAGWPLGSYALEVTAVDAQTASARTPLRIVNPTALALPIPSLLAQPDPYDSLSLQEKTDLVTYRLTPAQKVTLATLSDSGKANFLSQYWREHDARPQTPDNEDRLETITRYRYAIRYYSTEGSKQDGWKTDRGRVYIVYGTPDDSREVSSPRVGNPFLIWNYRQFREGAVFVFEDRRGLGDYRLVHSNVEGERFSKEWEELLREELLDVY